MFCTKCGAVLGNGKFCTSCGAPIEIAEPEAAAAVCEEFEETVYIPAEELAETVLEYEPTVIMTETAEISAAEEIKEETVKPAEDLCKSCGEPLCGRAFCVNCGTPASAPAPAPAEDTCKNCGSALNGKAFCVVCGTSKEGAAPKAAPAPVPAPAGDICKNCGSALNGKAFCVVCGTSKESAAPKAAPAPAPAPVADICKKCGSALNGKAFCIVCGTSKDGTAPVKAQPAPPVPPPVYTPAPAVQVNPLKTALGSGKFLFITILVTLYTLITMLSSSMGFDFVDMPAQINSIASSGVISVSVLPILICVGLWITYATAKGSGKTSSAGISICSGVMLVYYIVSWIPVVLAAIAGLVFFIPGLAMTITGRYEMFNGFITTDYGSGGALGGLFIGLGILVGAGVILIFVLLFYRRLWKFVKSVAISVKTEKTEFKFAKSSKNWLMFIGVVSIISAVIVIVIGLGVSSTSVLLTGAANLMSAIATICASSWIKKSCL